MDRQTWDSKERVVQPVTFHLTATETWLRQAAGSDYLPEGFEREGFIHCTDGEEGVLAAGNRYYTADEREYCLLTIKTAELKSPVIYEDDRQIFPHIYGPLNLDAVSVVRRVIRSEDGMFIGVGEPLP